MSTDVLSGHAQPSLESLISVDTGLVNRVDEGVVSYDHPRLISCFAHSCDTGPLFHARTSTTSGGIAADLRTARLAAIGESLERYSALHEPSSRLRRTHQRHVAQERPIAEPEWVIRPDNHLELPMHWAPGTLLHARGPGEPAWVAASRVYLSGVDLVPGLALTTSTGLAFHTDPWRALRSGLLEVIERDAFMLSWLGRAGARPIEAALRWQDDFGAPVRFDLASEDYRLYLLDSPTGVPVVLAVALGALDQPPVAVGAAAHPDLVLACRKALIEAKQTFDWCNFMLVRKRPVPGLDDVLTLEDHVAHYLNPTRIGAFDFLRSAGSPVSVDLSRPRLDDEPETQSRALVRACAEADFECFAVDVTTPDIRSIGGWVVRAVIPGMYPLTPGRDECTDHPRLLGLELNTDPHPFP